jgi:hypothetical protein
VATKERMAALGRLSAAIAHEIRQPLTAMAGAVKELGRLVPLQEDEQHLVGIVSRESERLNKIITEFLNYSREKTYEFSDEDVSGILDETLTLLERNPQVDGKYRIERAFTSSEVLVRVDRNASSKCSGICPTTPARHAHGGVLTVSLEAPPSGSASVSATLGRASIPGSAPKSSSRCNPILWVAQAWAWPSCTKSCRRTAAASACFRKRTRARNLRWICLESPDARALKD